MNTLATVASQFGILLACAFFAGGCATGPKYTYHQEPDSASIEGFRAHKQGQDDGSCVITIDRVDGMIVGFDVSQPGITWLFHPERMFLSPGSHTLLLDISEIDPEFGPHSGNSVGIIGGTASGNKPTVTVLFEANHTYRFPANLEGRSIDFTFWDETNGANSRTKVQSWSLDSNSQYTAEPHK